MTRKLPEKYKTCDWLWNYGSIGLTKEHIKRLNNAINILESLNEHTDAKSLREIQHKLLEDTPTIKKINTDAFIKKSSEVKKVDLEKEVDAEWDKCNPVDEGMGCEFATIGIEQFYSISKHFFELGMQQSKTQKGE